MALSGNRLEDRAPDGREALVETAAGDPAAEKQTARAAARTPADDLVEATGELFIRRHIKAQKSARESERLFRREIIAPWKRKRLADISVRDVHKLIDDVLDRPAPILANRVLTNVKTSFAFCVERGLVASSPADKIRQPSAEVIRDRWLDDAELKLVWAEAEREPPPFKSTLQLLILTGQRLGETAGMRWSELDLSARLWRLPAARCKNGKAHSVPLSPQALAIIESAPRIAGCDFVFSANGKSAVIGFSKVKRRLDSRLPQDMKPWRLHDVRRSVATGMARLGTDIAVIERVLNHVSGTSSRRRRHLSAAWVRRRASHRARKMGPSY